MVQDDLLARLRSSVRGEVRFDDGSRALYATDASNYRQVPIGVVIPSDAEDVIATVAACRAFDVPVLSRGGGTSLAGQCCNVAVVMDMSKHMNNIIEIHAEERWARVQPGVILDDLRKRANKDGLTYGPDPATHTHNTLGGMIGNNSCGMHAQMAGKVEENIIDLDILTYDGTRLKVGATDDQQLALIMAEHSRRGEIYRALAKLRNTYADDIRARFPDIPRRVSGYPLNELLPENGFNVARALVGTESTCVTILEAKVKLVPNPAFRTLAVFGFDDVYLAADSVPFVNKHEPIAVEGLDEQLIDDMRAKGMDLHEIAKMPEGQGWLMVEFGGDTRQQADDRARQLMEAFAGTKNPPSMKIVDDPKEEKKLWEVRESGLGATAKIPGKPDTWPGWEDSAVPPDRLGDYLRDLRALYDQYDYHCALYGHFGQACVHCRVDFDLTSADGIAKWRRFLKEAAQLVASYGGSLSGEHGDGQARGELLPIMYGERVVQAFREFKAIWDPQGKMNPGKVVDPYRVDENLRLGADYHPWEPKTHFSFEEHDRGSFAYATNRCVGVGKCRRTEGEGTMCPSFMATREEKNSTRGRARLLFEMLRGDPLTGGWREEAVKDALDLCLACKGCKSDCPVNVDMATYKAEFLSHYYEERPRPAAAYAFGLIPWWAQAASMFPDAVNFATQTPPFSIAAKAMAGMSQQRRVPLFARRTFRSWFRAYRSRNIGHTRVMLWPDTFNNHFHPATARAAVAVLEDAGFHVIIPRTQLCCGRPLYDYGMLTLAKQFLRKILDELRPAIEEGIHVVGLEPSCVSVFRDEMCNLFPDDPLARRLRRQTLLLSEFLEQQAPNYQPPRLERKAVVHAHCHHKSVLGTSAEEAILRKIGLAYEMPESGCCGMAGAFGFEGGTHTEVSIACAERVLIPKVREAHRDTLIVTDGFSCREQISQMTDRQALHLADVLKLALDHGIRGPVGKLPELAAMPNIRTEATLSACRGALGIGAVTAAGYAVGTTLARAVKRGRIEEPIAESVEEPSG